MRVGLSPPPPPKKKKSSRKHDNSWQPYNTLPEDSLQKITCAVALTTNICILKRGGGDSQLSKLREIISL